MNAIADRRKVIIERILVTFREAKDPDIEKLVWLICKDHNCTIRKAKEYVKIAQMLWEDERAKKLKELNLDQQRDPHAP